MECGLSSNLTGTKIIPADFIATVESHNPIGNGLHHEVMQCVCVCVSVCVRACVRACVLHVCVLSMSVCACVHGMFL